MKTVYGESAQRLAQQKKERKRVVRRRKIINGVAAGVLVVAMAVGFDYMLLSTWENEAQIDAQQMVEHRESLGIPSMSAEERAQAEKEYVEDHYSAETITSLKTSTINEYGILIDSIVENEALKTNSKVEPLDSNRLDKTIADYANYKANCEKDKVDYATATEETRISKAMGLYDAKQKVLKAELVEAIQNSKYLVPDSAEYIKNQENIKNINNKLGTIDSALEVVGERNVTIYFEKRNAEEGKQK